MMLVMQLPLALDQERGDMPHMCSATGQMPLKRLLGQKVRLFEGSHANLCSRSTSDHE